MTQHSRTKWFDRSLLGGFHTVYLCVRSTRSSNRTFPCEEISWPLVCLVGYLNKFTLGTGMQADRAPLPESSNWIVSFACSYATEGSTIESIQYSEYSHFNCWVCCNVQIDHQAALTRRNNSLVSRCLGLCTGFHRYGLVLKSTA